VNKTLQTLLDDENTWKWEMENRVQSLQAQVTEMQRLLNYPNDSSETWAASDATAFRQPGAAVPRLIAGHGGVPGHDPPPPRPDAVTAMTRESSLDPAGHQRNEDQAIVGTPMASLFEVTKLRNIRSDPSAHASLGSGRKSRQDFLAQGKIGLLEAEQLFATFRGTLSAYLWGGIALVHTQFSSAHDSSPILTAAILSVTALHAKDGGRSFDICYPIFLDLVSQAMFDRYHTLDDVRGLCIGAFWLSDVSWKLSGLAVRIATELNIHQSCAKALRDSPSETEKARLWYFLYVCDHHFSIAYGRPPVINEDVVITRHGTFLELPGVTQADYRLHSQVGVFIILSRVYHVFGLDSSKIVANDEFETLGRFDIDLGHWRDHWKSRLGMFPRSLSCSAAKCEQSAYNYTSVPDKYIGFYPEKGVVLHYYYARLQLFSLCLRGIVPTAQFIISPERCQFINLAISSASSALRLILDDEDMRKAVIGVPLYLLTTIAFASMFLMKVQSRWKCAQLDISFDAVTSLLEDIISLLNDNRGCVRHLASYIGRGLRNMLDKLKQDEAQEQQRLSASQSSPQSWIGGNMVQDWNQWMFSSELVPQFGGHEYYPLDVLNVLDSQMPG
jgi:hypothetical protein